MAVQWCGGDPGGHFPLLMATSSCGLSLQSGLVPDFMWVLTQITQTYSTLIPPPFLAAGEMLLLLLTINIAV